MPAFLISVIFSLIFKICLIKFCVYFAADLTVTCATDFHEKRYECVLVSKKCDKSIDDACKKGLVDANHLFPCKLSIVVTMPTFSKRIVFRMLSVELFCFLQFGYWSSLKCLWLIPDR